MNAYTHTYIPEIRYQNATETSFFLQATLDSGLKYSGWETFIRYESNRNDVAFFLLYNEVCGFTKTFVYTEICLRYKCFGLDVSRIFFYDIIRLVKTENQGQEHFSSNLSLRGSAAI